MRAIDISRIILRYTEYMTLTPLHLQRIMWCLYRDYYLEFGKPLFKEKFQAQIVGPMLMGIRHYYRMYGLGPIYSLPDMLMPIEDLDINQHAWIERKMLTRYRYYSKEDSMDDAVRNNPLWKKIWRENRHNRNPNTRWMKKGKGIIPIELIGEYNDCSKSSNSEDTKLYGNFKTT